MAFGNFKDLVKRTGSDKVLWAKAFKIVVNPKYRGHQRGLASVAYKYFDKKSAGNGNYPIWMVTTQNETTQFQQLAAVLADMELISKFNKEIKFLLCVIDIFCKYARVIPLKNKKGVTIVNALQSILNGSNGKPNKIWVDKLNFTIDQWNRG